MYRGGGVFKFLALEQGAAERAFAAVFEGFRVGSIKRIEPGQRGELGGEVAGCW